jgi:hypothetical protein
MKLVVTISALIVCLNLSAQKEEPLRIKWHDNSSGTSVLSSSEYVSAKKGMVLYCLTNDENNIYVDIKITESIEQNKVLQMGLILWVNTDGKSRKILGIRYPIGAKFSRQNMGRGESQGLNQESPLSLANSIELIGFKDILPNKFPSTNSDNFRGFIKYDSDGNLLYSMTIPISKLPAGDKTSEGKTFPLNLAIEYGAPPQYVSQSGKSSGYTPPPKITGSRGRSSGGSGGGSRGGSGGGSTGGRTTANASGSQDVPKSEIIWIKNITLSERK